MQTCERSKPSEVRILRASEWEEGCGVVVVVVVLVVVVLVVVVLVVVVLVVMVVDGGG